MFFRLFQPFCPCLHSKFVKRANSSIFSISRVYKNAEFDADFESVENVPITHAKKVINEKVAVKWSF
jgi:hypothetical protein